MPKLRESLKKPETYLVFFAVFLIAAAADAMRPAEQQRSARAYVGLIDVYQAQISPRMRSFVRCRYRPT